MFEEAWLIRHAESMGNAGFKTKSAAEQRLTPKGHGQAKILSDKLESLKRKPDLIVYSDYIRTQETMQPYLDLNPDIPTAKWDVHEFTYLSGEKYKNTSYKERIPHKNEFWKRADPEYSDDKNTESFNGFIDRVQDTINKLLGSDQKFIVIFTHGQFIKAVWHVITCDKLLRRQPNMKELYNIIENIYVPNTGILKIYRKDLATAFFGPNSKWD